ncbi:cAMP receptor protein [compost metagenome]
MSIHKISMFQGLTNLELSQILGKLNQIVLPAGAVLFQQGDEGDRMYMIQSGKIELFLALPDGKSQRLAVLSEGDTLGEMALLTGEPRSAMAKAATDIQLYEIDAATLQVLIEDKASISAYFIRLLSERLIQTNSRLQASKEAKSTWIVQELANVPLSIIEVLQACALLPVASQTLLQSYYGLDSLIDELTKYPVLNSYIHMNPEDKDLFTIEQVKRATLSDLYMEKHTYQVKNEWLKAAADHFLAVGRISLVVQLYAETGDWKSVVGVLQARTAEVSVTPKVELEIYGYLDRCPNEVLFSQFAVLERYIHTCMEQGKKIGLERLEAALEQENFRYTTQQTELLYEWGAELARRLDMKQKALEFLQMAEYIAISHSDSSGQLSEERDRSYRLAKQRLDSQKSTQLAAVASGFWKRSRLTTVLSLLGALGCMIYFHFAPPIGGLSRQGMDFSGISIAAVILWIVNIVPDYIVALFMAMLWTVGGLVEPEVALSGFATSTWLYMFFILAIGAVIAKSGILYRLSLHALKLFPLHYRGQLWGIIVGGALLNPLIPSSSAKVALGVPIARTLSELMGFKERSKGSAGLGLAAMIFYGFTAPFVLTGSYTNMMAFGLVQNEEQVSWFQWFLYALPAFLIFVVVMLVGLSFLFKRVKVEKPVSQEVLTDQLALLGKLTKEEKITTLTVLGSIGLMILQPLHGIDHAWVMLLGFSILVVSGVLDSKTLKSSVDWTFLLFIGVAFSFAEAAQQLGIIDAMTSFLGDYMEPFMTSPILFLVAVVLVSFLITLVVRDDPAVILLTISMLPLAQQVGIHPWILVFVILLSTDPFLFAYQSPTYLTAYYSTEGKSFSHRQGQQVAICYAAAVILVAVSCVPYWTWLGLIK